MATKQNGDGIRRGIYFHPEAFKKADRMPAAEGISRSRLINKAINHYAERNDGKYL